MAKSKPKGKVGHLIIMIGVPSSRPPKGKGPKFGIVAKRAARKGKR